MSKNESFWKAEYCSLARAGVEKMAELGVVVDPAERMIEAAEYRESKLPKGELSVDWRNKSIHTVAVNESLPLEFNNMVPSDEVWFTDRDDKVIGKIKNIGATTDTTD